MRKDRGIVIRIKRKKMTTRRRLGKSDAGEKKDIKEELEGEVEEVIQEALEEVEKPEEIVKAEPEEKGKTVLPGNLIGTCEEFTPKSGTYVDKGNIYASASGIVKINTKERSISVFPVTKTPPHLQVGDIVIGQVTDVKDSVALVEIAGIKGRGEREIVNAEQAAIHVSNVKDAYVPELYYEFAPFDIVKARVIDLRNMRLTTVNKELGVMKAYCTNCRAVLKKDNGKLKCPRCERTETRKLSSDYGTGIV
ncbi:MAG: exosome complex RNA-binding protein Csl4 [Candidatus Methanoperedens sp.]|nr:exosome complex RNA-binding protein Csl4 [Candidatus Methanoperedenaceae archaeon]MDP2766032.1 exosome complex RNA-binding protein Csl4 [Candidatus Methanoperedens sp.]